MIANEEDSANSFAKELKVQIESYFAFALDPNSKEFLAEYWTACYLDPVKKGILTPSQVEIVQSYLLSMFNLSLFINNFVNFKKM